MRRDTIFYQLFRQSPTLLFELISQPPLDADRYSFDSVEVKETSFRMDGVFLPPNPFGEELPTGLSLMVLTTLEGDEAKTEARGLIERARGERAIIDLISTIMVYKFSSLTRDEVDVMLGIELAQTRVYQEAKAEGKAEGRAEGRAEGLEVGIQQERALVIKQLNRKLGNLSPQVQAKVSALSVERVESLGEALLDFTSMTGLEVWLGQN